MSYEEDGPINEELYDKALEAIRNLFGDTSVSKSVAKANLRSLIGEISIMLEGLEGGE